MLMILLYFLIISYIGQILKPVEKFSSLMNFSGPLVNHIKIVQEEIACLIYWPHNKVILALLEEPLGLALVKKKPTLLNFIQLYYVARLMREFTLALVGDENSLNWIDVEKSWVSVHS